MRMPKKINNKITKTNVVFCSRDMLESDNEFPKGTKVKKRPAVLHPLSREIRAKDHPVSFSSIISLLSS